MAGRYYFYFEEIDVYQGLHTKYWLSLIQAQIFSSVS